MPRLSQAVQGSVARRIARVCRLLLYAVVSALCLLLLGQSFLVEAFHVPTGSMAPALLGHHRVCTCPRCGQSVVIGNQPGGSEARAHRQAFCSNCGKIPLNTKASPGVAGDEIRVNRGAFWLRTPSRWEILVFRFLNTFYIKRLLGLPGEEILLRDGDLYVNGRLCRKTLEEARRLCVPVFEQANAPGGAGWADRWVGEPSSPPTDPSPGKVPVLMLDGRLTPHLLTYRNFSLDARKCEPIRDEYVYNAGSHTQTECVHDFLVEAEIEIVAGQGSLSLRLSDGGDWAEILLPIGETLTAEGFAWPVDSKERLEKLAESRTSLSLETGRKYRVGIALVDRRLSFALDGKLQLTADLSECGKRREVTHPFQARADGVQVRLLDFRLCRDVHYTQQGRNGVNGNAVRLGPDQYFMLGDNSPRSEDSRFWPECGNIRFRDLLGPVMWVRR